MSAPGSGSSCDEVGKLGVPEARTSTDELSRMRSTRLGLSSAVTLRNSSVAPVAVSRTIRLKRSLVAIPGNSVCHWAARSGETASDPVSTRARSAFPHAPGYAASSARPFASIVALAGSPPAR